MSYRNCSFFEMKVYRRISGPVYDNESAVLQIGRSLVRSQLVS